MQTEKNTSTRELFVKMAIDAWQIQNDRVNKFLEGVDDARLMDAIAPGKNRGIYLLGHLVAVSDGMLPLFGLGEKMYPELFDPFVKNPDNAAANFPSVQTLRKYWNDVNARLSQKFSGMTADEWFERHTAVSQEDFAKEPHRNKLNVVMNRTSHQSYHLGQLVLLKR